MTRDARDPGTATVVLHWLVAIGVIGMIGFGIYIGGLERGPEKTALVQVHKSFGIVVGLLALLRLCWRVREGFFPPPSPRPAWEQRLARLSHVTMLLLTVAIPVTGILKSVTYARPVEVFGLPFLPQLMAEKNVPLNEAVSVAHEGFAWALLALIVLHIAAALKHHLLDRDRTLARMLPGGRDRTLEA